MDGALKRMMDAADRFCAEREWEPYHNPKDLAIGLSTEAAELLEHFRFESEEASEGLMKETVTRQAIEEELCDALWFILRFASRYDIDLESAFRAKLQKNAVKYPGNRA